LSIAQWFKLRKFVRMSILEQQRFLTVDELAAYLRVSRSLAYKLVWGGKVPRVRVGGCWRIPRHELDAQLAEQAAKGAKPRA
jgi:excisionase family DNA binding protein